ncbi:hypothetical protein AB1Y20_007859 [Prymnesium parvum]|uniref:Uncharacterized protein n=1 Tax=Prymnesium parvum TaxID=97485 RepID=A0AB34IS38_PRYPA
MPAPPAPSAPPPSARARLSARAGPPPPSNASPALLLLTLYARGPLAAPLPTTVGILPPPHNLVLAAAPPSGAPAPAACRHCPLVAPPPRAPPVQDPHAPLPPLRSLPPPPPTVPHPFAPPGLLPHSAPPPPTPSGRHADAAPPPQASATPPALAPLPAPGHALASTLLSLLLTRGRSINFIEPGRPPRASSHAWSPPPPPPLSAPPFGAPSLPPPPIDHPPSPPVGPHPATLRLLSPPVPRPPAPPASSHASALRLSVPPFGAPSPPPPPIDHPPSPSLPSPPAPPAPPACPHPTTLQFSSPPAPRPPPQRPWASSPRRLSSLRSSDRGPPNIPHGKRPLSPTPHRPASPPPAGDTRRPRAASSAGGTSTSPALPSPAGVGGASAPPAPPQPADLRRGQPACAGGAPAPPALPLPADIPRAQPADTLPTDLPRVTPSPLPLDHPARWPPRSLPTVHLTDGPRLRDLIPPHNSLFHLQFDGIPLHTSAGPAASPLLHPYTALPADFINHVADLFALLYALSDDHGRLVLPNFRRPPAALHRATARTAAAHDIPPGALALTLDWLLQYFHAGTPPLLHAPWPLAQAALTAVLQYLAHIPGATPLMVANFLHPFLLTACHAATDFSPAARAPLAPYLVAAGAHPFPIIDDRPTTVPRMPHPLDLWPYDGVHGLYRARADSSGASSSDDAGNDPPVAPPSPPSPPPPTPLAASPPPVTDPSDDALAEAPPPSLPPALPRARPAPATASSRPPPPGDPRPPSPPPPPPGSHAAACLRHCAFHPSIFYGFLQRQAPTPGAASLASALLLTSVLAGKPPQPWYHALHVAPGYGAVFSSYHNLLMHSTHIGGHNRKFRSRLDAIIFALTGLPPAAVPHGVLPDPPPAILLDAPPTHHCPLPPFAPYAPVPTPPAVLVDRSFLAV